MERVLFWFWGGFFLNKTALGPLHREPSPVPSALRAPPQDGARRPEVSLRQLPGATVRHGRDAAGAEPDAALEPVRGAGGGAAGPRGVAAGEGEARPGLLGGETFSAGGGGGGDRPGKAGGPGALLSPQQRGSAARNKLRQRVLWSVKTSASLSAVRQPLPDRIFLLNAVA